MPDKVFQSKVTQIQLVDVDSGKIVAETDFDLADWVNFPLDQHIISLDQNLVTRTTSKDDKLKAKPEDNSNSVRVKVLFKSG